MLIRRDGGDTPQIVRPQQVRTAEASIEANPWWGDHFMYKSTATCDTGLLCHNVYSVAPSTRGNRPRSRGPGYGVRPPDGCPMFDTGRRGWRMTRLQAKKKARRIPGAFPFKHRWL